MVIILPLSADEGGIENGTDNDRTENSAVNDSGHTLLLVQSAGYHRIFGGYGRLQGAYQYAPNPRNTITAAMSLSETAPFHFNGNLQWCVGEDTGFRSVLRYELTDYPAYGKYTHGLSWTGAWYQRHFQFGAGLELRSLQSDPAELKNPFNFDQNFIELQYLYHLAFLFNTPPLSWTIAFNNHDIYEIRNGADPRLILLVEYPVSDALTLTGQITHATTGLLAWSTIFYRADARLGVRVKI